MPHTLQPLPYSGPATPDMPAKKRGAWRTPLLVVLGVLALLVLAAVLGAASLATHVLQEVAQGSEGVRVVINGQPWHGWGDDALPGGFLGALLTWLVGAVLAVALVAVVMAVVVGVVGFVAVPLLVAGAAVVLAGVLAVVLAVLVGVFGSGLAVVATVAVVLSPLWLVGWLLWRLMSRTKRRAAPATATPAARMAA